MTVQLQLPKPNKILKHCVQSIHTRTDPNLRQLTVNLT